jgi:hypothetical protein
MKMKRGTKEHYDLMAQFEKDVRTMPIYTGGKVERYSRDEKVPSSEFYTNGQVNALFLMYMQGYALAKRNYQSN